MRLDLQRGCLTNPGRPTRAPDSLLPMIIQCSTTTSTTTQGYFTYTPPARIIPQHPVRLYDNALAAAALTRIMPPLRHPLVPYMRTLSDAWFLTWCRNWLPLLPAPVSALPSGLLLVSRLAKPRSPLISQWHYHLPFAYGFGLTRRSRKPYT